MNIQKTFHEDDSSNIKKTENEFAQKLFVLLLYDCLSFFASGFASLCILMYWRVCKLHPSHLHIFQITHFHPNLDYHETNNVA